MPVARWLRESGVEAAAPRTRNVSPYAVENARVLLILVETVVQETSEEAAALRNSKADRALNVIVLVRQQRLTPDAS